MYTSNSDDASLASNEAEGSGRKIAEVVFYGDARDSLRSFPEAVKEDLGYALYQLQLGQVPPDSKSVHGIGSGIFELREQDAQGWYRVLYCRREDVIHVLHVFKKQGNRIERHDLDLADRRFRQMIEEERETKRYGKRG